MNIELADANFFMLNELMMDDEAECEMQRRRIKLSDGRYMIFYTFGETQPALALPDTTIEQLNPVPHTDTKDERNV